ncbi:MAG TPA: hypothetical protein GX012_01390 [Acholeplasma sp.]|nr:hypothetical protein [Acholeplasma sp.]
MTEQFDKIIKAERKIKEEIAKANLQKEELLASALDEGTIEANKIHEETDTKIKEKLAEKKQKLSETDEKIQNVVKEEEEKIAKKVSTKTDKIIDKIFKEALNDD